ncbi:MAG: hypothetical protein ABR499_19170 [Gemmatimonadaceae bacterium]
MAASNPDGPVLSAADRARLRPTVDADAFERFLEQIPEEVRPGVQRAAVLHFSRAVTMADIRDFLNEVGNDDAAAAVDRAIAAAPATEPDTAASEPTPLADRLFSMEPPKSPRLRALWDAIEPQPPTPG